MSKDKDLPKLRSNVAIDGHYYESAARPAGNLCLGCVAINNQELCKKLPACMTTKRYTIIWIKQRRGNG